MSLSLGSQAFDAAQRLKHTEDWRVLMGALSEQMGRLMHSAVETATPENCGYARGVRDVLWCFEIMEAGPNAPSRATIKPTLPVRPPTTSAADNPLGNGKTR
jgi:hypothetical protein